MLVSHAESKSAAASKGGSFKLLGCLAEVLGACSRAKAADDQYAELDVLSDAELAWLACARISSPRPRMGYRRRAGAAMKADYKRPPPRPVESQALIDLGRDLFWDPRVSASGRTACASCHYPYLGWGTTEPKSRNDSGKLTSRRSQPLIGIGHAVGPIGWDGRSATLEAEAKASIASGSMSMRETDTPVKVEEIEERLRAISEYVAKFNAALPGTAINIDAIAKAIADYERAIEPGIAPFDRWIEGDEDAVSQSAKRGFVLFNGKAECFLCHSGWRFTNDSFHDIGVATKERIAHPAVIPLAQTLDLPGQARGPSVGVPQTSVQ